MQAPVTGYVGGRGTGVMGNTHSDLLSGVRLPPDMNLATLLKHHVIAEERWEYRFTMAGRGTGDDTNKNRDAAEVHFSSIMTRSHGFSVTCCPRMVVNCVSKSEPSA